MPKNKAAATPQSPVTAKPLGPLDIPQDTSESVEEIKVNNANLVDLKNALDDLLKKYLSRQGLFTQNHTHTDVKLVLGYLSVSIALATALYSYKTPFEESKFLTAIGVGLYFLLTSLSTAYAYLIEKQTVFLGKRRNFASDGRIETDRLKVESSSKVESKSLFSLPSRLAWALSPQSRSNSSQVPGSAASGGADEPKYALTYTYTLTASSGRSLLAKRSVTKEVPYSKFFDENGVLLQPAFTSWLGHAIQAAVTGE
ncbi:signal peptidase complex subunit 2 [Flagelloscypha sp. PMI_526]|nr:signal peptidase complex subunit 2 [Flagelloscypha sp. PMI_526]